MKTRLFTYSACLVISCSRMASCQTDQGSKLSSGSQSYTGALEQYLANFRISVRGEAENVAALTEKLKQTNARVEAGAAPKSEAANAKRALDFAIANLDISTRNLALAERSGKLNKPVTVQLNETPLQEAAIALSESSGLRILVDKSVKQTIKVTLAAREVSLGTTLEALADRAKLMIAPEANGVVLKLWPSLTIGGKEVQATGVNAPWSDEWGPSAAYLEASSDGSKWKIIPSLAGPLLTGNKVDAANLDVKLFGNARYQGLANNVAEMGRNQKLGGVQTPTNNLASNQGGGGGRASQGATGYQSQSYGQNAARSSTKSTNAQVSQYNGAQQPLANGANTSQSLQNYAVQAKDHILNVSGAYGKSDSSQNTKADVRSDKSKSASYGQDRSVANYFDSVRLNFQNALQPQTELKRSSVASLGGNLFVLAEPSTDKNGIVGTLLTVFKFEKDKIVKLTSMFHPSEQVVLP